jgi:hypothetical protein
LFKFNTWFVNVVVVEVVVIGGKVFGKLKCETEGSLFENCKLLDSTRLHCLHICGAGKKGVETGLQLWLEV